MSIWPNKTSSGSSYCIDQSPGAERFGGLSVTLRPRRASRPEFTVRPTNYFKGAAVDEKRIRSLADAAMEGIRAGAAELGVDLGEFDIELADFAYHPVDSRHSTFRGAGAAAFRAAWAGWERYEGK